MTVKQIVLGVKNRQGELSRIISHLYENDVRVCAFWVGTENEKATLRFIASDPAAAMSVLTGLGYKAKTKNVIAAQIPDHPGGLNTILKVLHAANINILRVFPSFDVQNTALILEVDRTKAAVKALQENWINLYDKKIYDL
jgi:hypothetical protein